MIAAGSLDYAQARLQARQGARSGAAAAAGWHRVETVRDLAALLDVARGTSLRPWLVGVTPDSSSDDIEAALRAHWREAVAEVRDWMPPAWQRAVAWFALLPDLAPLQHLARGEAPAAWLLADPAWHEVAGKVLDRPGEAGVQAAAGRGPGAGGPHGGTETVDDDGMITSGMTRSEKAGNHEKIDIGGRESLPAPAGAASRLAGAGPAAIGSAWRAEWRSRWPAMTDDARQSMLDFERIVADHITCYAQGSDPGVALGAAPVGVRLARLWRRVALQPAAAFVYLALAALDLQRLRAELLRRRLFARWSPA